MGQFERVEDLRRVAPGEAATLIPSWNTGFELLLAAEGQAGSGGIVRPGQKLQVLGQDGRRLQVRQEADGLEGWLPSHVVAPWPS